MILNDNEIWVILYKPFYLVLFLRCLLTDLRNKNKGCQFNCIFSVLIFCWVYWFDGVFFSSKANTCRLILVVDLTSFSIIPNDVYGTTLGRNMKSIFFLFENKCKYSITGLCGTSDSRIGCCTRVPHGFRWFI